MLKSSCFNLNSQSEDKVSSLNQKILTLSVNYPYNPIKIDKSNYIEENKLMKTKIQK